MTAKLLIYVPVFSVIAVLVLGMGYAINDKLDARAKMTPEERYMSDMGYEYVTLGGKKFIRNCNGNTKTHGQLTPLEDQ